MSYSRISNLRSTWVLEGGEEDIKVVAITLKGEL